jgi:hypothetical protein
VKCIKRARDEEDVETGRGILSVHLMAGNFEQSNFYGMDD